MKKNNIISIFFLSALCCLGSSLSAGAITIALVDGDWKNKSPNSNSIDISNSGSSGGLSTVRWGSGAQQSGYNFNSRATSFDAPADGTPFEIGTFTHLNYPISGTTLDSIDLKLTMGTIINFGTTFSFTHDETSNNANPATNPANNDLVTINNPIVNVGFNYLGDNYFFNLVGFSINSGATIATQFSTVETQANSAKLYGMITRTPVINSTVPDSGGSVLLLGISMVGFGALRKWRK